MRKWFRWMAVMTAAACFMAGCAREAGVEVTSMGGDACRDH